jgi:phage gp36-like protein
MTDPYATATDLTKRFDARVIGDLVNDQNTRVDPTSLATNANVLAALDDATSIINSAVLVANRYDVDDLAAMKDIDAALLIRLTCNLAYGLLVMRRGQSVEKLDPYQDALKMLDHLRAGDRVFNIAGNEDAGNVQGSFPSSSVYSSLQLIRDVSKVFPVRRNQQVQ